MRISLAVIQIVATLVQMGIGWYAIRKWRYYYKRCREYFYELSVAKARVLALGNTIRRITGGTMVVEPEPGEEGPL